MKMSKDNKKILQNFIDKAEKFKKDPNYEK